MARKRWTPQTEITESLIRIREKKKWQLSYRRYVLEKQPSESYAPYFGLDIETLRNWFELQFTDELNWDNFGKAWQFEHIVPATYFDYSNEADLLLCWNFINIRVEKLEQGKTGEHRINPLATRSYFQDLYNKTAFPICMKMLDKIAMIEDSIEYNPAIVGFIIDNKKFLEHLSSFDHEEFNSLNKGVTPQEILLEREILRKFGSGQKP